MLEEAIDVIRELWSGDTVDHGGDFYEVENARLFDPPDDRSTDHRVGLRAEAVDLAAQIGDGYWGPLARPRAAAALRARRAAPDLGTRSSTLCWADDEASAQEDRARDVAQRGHPRSAVAGPADLDALRAGRRTRHRGGGHQVGAVRARGRTGRSSRCSKYIDAGYDHLYFHQIGPDQDGFFRFWTDTLQPALAVTSTRSARKAGSRQGGRSTAKKKS